ncbi:hypothetical protein WA158_004928 [Blastocystis sp. Blastoise]
MNKEIQDLFYKQLIGSTLDSNYYSFDENAIELWEKKSAKGIITSIPFLHTIDSFQMIEFSGSSGTGKTSLAYDVLYHCILHEQYGGLESNAVLFDMDNKLDLVKLIRIIENKIISIREVRLMHPEQIHSLLYEMFGRITVYTPTSLQHLHQNLISLIQSEKSIRLVVYDSFLAYLFELQKDSIEISLFKAVLLRTKELLRVKKASAILITPMITTNKQNIVLPHFLSNYIQITCIYSCSFYQVSCSKLSKEPSIFVIKDGCFMFQ